MLVFSSETMEKLLKREKEVSTLTSQVEALKSQVGGKLSAASDVCFLKFLCKNFCKNFYGTYLYTHSA